MNCKIQEEGWPELFSGFKKIFFFSPFLLFTISLFCFSGLFLKTETVRVDSKHNIKEAFFFYFCLCVCVCFQQKIK